jgi:hypothetical protein
LETHTTGKAIEEKPERRAKPEERKCGKSGIKQDRQMARITKKQD